MFSYWWRCCRETINFNLERSQAAANAGCLAGASGSVTVRSIGPVEVMTVRVSGLPANKGFDTCS